jgi:glutamine amidotransferase
MIVSEPFSDLPGVWNEIPESTVFIVQPGADEQLPFAPRRVTASVGAPA